MKVTQYQKAKNELKNISIHAKNAFVNDKPAIRMQINDSINWVSDNYSLTDHKNSLLHDYACTLHP
mgnify:CR=1 FL=1|tara:strand:+ start:1924 stop:2121 length:198 start_codon:yes stop_codon:yes gene_type:complete